MSSEMSLELIKRIRFGHLGCCRDSQPYVVPIGYAHHDDSLYCCGTVGQKIEWMRDNPRVCVEIEEIRSRQDWATVVLSGRYVELTEEPRFLDQRVTAHEELAREPYWWQPGFSPTLADDGARPIRPLFFRIVIESVRGHFASPGDQEQSTRASWPAI
jgi:nitroimidazol reductase NimA-like FMN-containing flavoprotein (pyridoxamine 5'-phosphate oxidase superfamily)